MIVHYKAGKKEHADVEDNKKSIKAGEVSPEQGVIVTERTLFLLRTLRFHNKLLPARARGDKNRKRA